MDVTGISSDDVPQSFAGDTSVHQAKWSSQEALQLATLRAAIDQGFASGIAEDGVFERVRKCVGLLPRA